MILHDAKNENCASLLQLKFFPVTSKGQNQYEVFNAHTLQENAAIFHRQQQEHPLSQAHTGYLHSSV